MDAKGVPNSDIIVVSDHGFAPFHTSVDLNAYLQQKGFNPNEVRAVTSGPAVNVYINLQGREPGGTVSRARYVQLRKQVQLAMNGLTDTNTTYTNGAKSVNVFDKVYARPVPSNLKVPAFGLGTSGVIGQDGGDEFVLLKEGHNFDGVQATPVVRQSDAAPADPAQRPVLSVPNFYGAHGYDPALSDMSAMLIAAGPDIGHKTLAKVSNLDIAPTIDKLLGEPPASTVQGKAIAYGPAAVAPSVTRLVLVNADTGATVRTLSAGDVLSLSALPKHLSVRADVAGTVGSVRFGLDVKANFNSEDAAPFAMTGNSNGKYVPVALAKGSHTVTARAFVGLNATGLGSDLFGATFKVTG